jgi:hypothetical protein
MVKQGALFKNYKEDTLRLAAKGFPKRRGGLDKGEVKLALLEVYEALRGEGEQNRIFLECPPFNDLLSVVNDLPACRVMCCEKDSRHCSAGLRVT